MRKSVSIVFRTEASHLVGMGHVMRCIAIAESLSLQVKFHFVISDSPEVEKIKRLLISKGAEVYILPSFLSEEKEVAKIACLVKKINAKICITDLCHSDILNDLSQLFEYHIKLRAIKELFVISIEDNRFTKFSSHVAILYNALFEEAQDKVRQDDCLILKGAKYFICNPAIATIAKKERFIRQQAARILVCIGGSDIQEVTLKVIQALTDLPKNFEIKVVLGMAFKDSYRMQLEAIVKQMINFELIEFSNQWGELLLWTDLVIVGEGTIKFDAAITGTPAIMISQFDHNSQPIQDFLSLNIVNYLGSGCALSLSNILVATQELLENYPVRLRMSQRGKAIFDGQGMKHICKMIVKHYPEIKEIINEMG